MGERKHPENDGPGNYLGDIRQREGSLRQFSFKRFPLIKGLRPSYI